MPFFREFDAKSGTVQFKNKGWNITPKMKVNDPKELLEGLGKALDEAYRKLRDAKID